LAGTSWSAPTTNHGTKGKRSAAKFEHPNDLSQTGE
jgi:hypothetical protein